MRYFLRVLTKKTIYWKFWEDYRKFWKFLFGNLLKCIILAIFSNKLTNHAFIFARLDEKHKLLGYFEKILKFIDENSVETLNFYNFYFFENLLLKIEPSEINPIFLQQFFSNSGAGILPPPFHLATPFSGRVGNSSLLNIVEE